MDELESHGKINFMDAVVFIVLPYSSVFACEKDFYFTSVQPDFSPVAHYGKKGDRVLL